MDSVLFHVEMPNITSFSNVRTCCFLLFYVMENQFSAYISLLNKGRINSWICLFIQIHIKK